jgi:hypothetical protein
MTAGTVASGATTAATIDQFWLDSAAAPTQSPDASISAPSAATSSVSATIVRDRHNIPRGAEAIARYLTLPPANESAPPVGFEGFSYGTNTTAALMPTPEKREDLVGGIGTPPAAGELLKAGAANAFSPEFRQLLNQAITANGGLGDSQNGYLAFSREFGFVRFRNPNFTPEENRKLAAMSLQTGWPLERLPCRQDKNSTIDDPKMSAWVEKFIGKYETKFAEFLADPSKGLMLKDGSRNRYAMQFDPQSGRVFSQASRRKGGFAGFVQKNMSWMAPVLTAVSAIAAPFAPYVSAGIQALKSGLTSVVTGKFGVGQALQLATSFIPGVGDFFKQVPVAGVAAGAAAEAIDTGKVSWGNVLSQLGGAYLKDLPGGDIVDTAAQTAANVIGAKIDGRNLDFMALASEFGPLLAAVGKETGAADLLERVGTKVGGDPTDTSSWFGTLSQIFKDDYTRDAISAGISTLAKLVQGGQITPNDAARLVEHFGVLVLSQTEFGQRALAEQRAAQAGKN